MWKKLQEELKPWVLHNFGERPKHQALLGIFEERGELTDATEEHQIIDAVADMGVYIADYANSTGVVLDELPAPFSSLLAAPSSTDRIQLTLCIGDRRLPVQSHYQHLLLDRIASPLGRLAHAHLKQEQGIRKNEDHDATRRQALADIIGILEVYSKSCGFDFWEVLYATWNKVKQRDWKKDANKGGESHAGTAG